MTGYFDGEQIMLVKALVVGDPAVGKSRLIERMAGSEFKPNYKATVGADFLFREVKYRGQRVSIQLWDTAGAERFEGLGSAFFRGSNAAVVVMDSTQAFDSQVVPDWVQGVKEHVGNNIEFYFLINKIDKKDALHDDFKGDNIRDKLYDLVSDVVQENKKEDFKENHIFYCSAKDNTNLEKILKQIAKDMCFQKALVSNDELSDDETPQKPLTFKQKLEAYTSPWNWFIAALKAVFSAFQFTLSWRKWQLANQLEKNLSTVDETNTETRRNLIQDCYTANEKMVKEELDHSFPVFQKNYMKKAPVSGEQDKDVMDLGALGKILEDELSQCKKS